MATKPAINTPRQRVISTRGPARPSSAGRSVIELIIVTSTVTDAPTARPDSEARPISRIPSNDMTTVIPANTTERPAVSIARIVAWRGVSPLCRPSR